MKGAFPILLVLLACSAPLSAEQRVYKWTDADGVVHYSQTAPDKIQAEAKDVHSRDPAKPASTAPTTETKSPESDACTAAKRNRDLLAGSGPVARDVNGDGKPETISDDQRATALLQAKFQVSRFCTGSAEPAPTP